MSRVPEEFDEKEFATDEFRDYTVYSSLARTEKNPNFKKILEELAAHEKAHWEFWRQLAMPTATFYVSRVRLFGMQILRRVFGLTFIVKLFEQDEKTAIKNYTAFAAQPTTPIATVDMRARLQQIIADEKYHEQALVAQVKEEKVEFMGNIVLGLNDGLIELSGALVGFAFAFARPIAVGLMGIITGVAASLSMAASAFMHEQYEQTRTNNPKKAAMYTGSAYLVVVVLLVLPFLLASHIWTAIGLMALVVFAIVAGVSYYSSVLLQQKFRRQFGEMLALSVGVAIIAFLIGSLVQFFGGEHL